MFLFTLIINYKTIIRCGVLVRASSTQLRGPEMESQSKQILYGTLLVSTIALQGVGPWFWTHEKCSLREVTPMLAMESYCNNLPGCRTSLCSEECNVRCCP